MKTIVLATTATALFAAVPVSVGTAVADNIQLAQVDVRIGPRGGPGVVIGEERRYRVRDRDRDDCRKITITEWRNGVKVKRTKWRCD